MLLEILNKNLDIIFLIYGASFFSMGVTIFTQRPSKESSFKLAYILWLLAAFGIIHGINEWLDMIAIIKGFHSKIWNTTSAIILTLSFIFLFEFGRRLTVLHTKRFFNKWFSIIPALIVTVLIFIPGQPQSIWPRYFLGLPAGLLSAYGLIFYYKDNKTILKMLKIRQYFFIAAWVLGIYAILGGLITPKGSFFLSSIINNSSFSKNFGIPVQLLRAICAIILSIASYNILKIFHWESTIELKSALLETTAAKVYIENILKSIIDTLIVIDSKAKIRAINKTGCQILGYEEHEMLGKSMTNLFKKETILKGKTLRKFIKKGSLKNLEVICYAKDKEEIPMLFSGSVMRDTNGRINGIVGVGKDIRELKNLQMKLVEAEKFAAMGKVSGIIGHEFRNQLGILRNAVYYLKIKLQNKDTKIDKHLMIMDNEIVEIERTIENILTFARTKRPEFKTVNLNTILSEVLERLAIPKGIIVTTEIDKNLPEITADDIQINRIFINLILNAVDAMGKEGKLNIALKNTGDHILIQFSDTGQGIKNEDKNKIFEPFFSTKTKGTGLGLATAKMIIEAHQGNIDIESAVNKGAKITIKLPINQNKRESSPSITQSKG